MRERASDLSLQNLANYPEKETTNTESKYFDIALNDKAANCQVTVAIPTLAFPRMSHIWDALHDFAPFLQFKKREKHPWRSVTFTK